MDRRREEYVSPVGFAREPRAERRRWIGRVFLGILLVLIGWLLVNRVFKPPADTPRAPIETTLPGD